MHLAKKITDRPWRIFFALNTALALFLIFFKLNPLQIDIGGHIASANVFARGFFHFFNDQIFLGYIPNLFYPPAEDLLITLVSAPFRAFPILGYQIYLSLLFTSVFLSIYRIGKLLYKNESSRNLFYTLFLTLFWSSKIDSVLDQGIGAFDTLSTGLSAQLLGFIPFAWLLREILTKKRSNRIGLLLALTAFSHLIMGLSASLLVGIYFLSAEKKKPLFIELVLGLALTAGFTFPFLFYGDFLVNRTIVLPDFALVPLFTPLLLLFLPVEKLKENRSVVITALILFWAMPLVSTLDLAGVGAPKLHYYRFTNVALMTGIFIISANTRKWIFNTCLLIAALACFQPYISLNGWFNAETPAKVELTSGSLTNEKNPGRTFIVSNFRPIDFGTESLLSLKYPDLKSVKGLYWESAVGNHVVNAYIANLIDPEVILDSIFYLGTACPVTQCLFDQFIRDYSISTLIFDPKDLWLKRATQTASCWNEMKSKSGTQSYTFAPIGTVRAETDSFISYSVTPKTEESKLLQSLIEPIRPEWIQEIPPNSENAISHTRMKEKHLACIEQRPSKSLYLGHSEFVRFKKFALEKSTTPFEYVDPKFYSQFHIQKVRDGKYTVTLPGGTPSWVSIKLASLPGWTWKDSTGKVWPLLNGFPSLIGSGQGEMTLEWKRPIVFWIGYGISILAFLSILIRWIMNRRLKTASPSHLPEHEVSLLSPSRFLL